MANVRIGIIGGSGLEEALGMEKGQTVWPETPFGKPSSPITLTRWGDTEVALIQRHGIGHVHAPTFVPYRANIFALKTLGVTHIVATGATGSLRENIQPGQVLIPDQIIDKTYRRANTFYEGAVHVELADPFCDVTRQWLLNAAKKQQDVHVHEKGTYVCMEGPAFSTKAESHMHRAWGADVVGMTVMPEARLAREAELAYALVALPTDYDCWRAPEEGQDKGALLEEIIGNLKKASSAGLAIIKAALGDVSQLSQPSAAHEALKLAIWSDKAKIHPDEVTRLRPLWGKYF